MGDRLLSHMADVIIILAITITFQFTLHSTQPPVAQWFEHPKTNSEGREFDSHRPRLHSSPRCPSEHRRLGTERDNLRGRLWTRLDSHLELGIFFLSFLVLAFSFFQNNYNETRVGYDWTGQHVSSHLCLFPIRAITTITITVIQRKPERFMIK